jgi:hypothetical protein
MTFFVAMGRCGSRVHRRAAFQHHAARRKDAPHDDRTFAI